MNTGIQRMVRGMHQHLERRTSVTPVQWIRRLTAYCRLSATEQRFLVAPFHRYRRATGRPERLGRRLRWPKKIRDWQHEWNQLPLPEKAAPEEILLVPEIFQDNRIASFLNDPRWFPGRCFAVFHDAAVLRFPEGAEPKHRAHFTDYVRALARFDKVFCVSKEAETDLRFYWKEMGVPSARTSVLSWPTDFSQPRPEPAPNFGARRILCVSTLEGRKNHLRLLEAAEILWADGLDFELILIGRDDGHWGPRVREEIGRLAARRRRIRWVGHVDDESLHRAYRDCSFTVYPSLIEGYGLPIMESLWHGRPCACGGNGALGEVADGGGCRRVDQHDVRSIAEGLRELLTNETSYARLFEEACRRTFRSWEDYVDDLLKEITVS
jgi:glycosyltransferase involved in cell wall biosynthesis